MSGIKYDTDKPIMSLIPGEVELALAHVLTYGAKKYNAENWRGGINYNRVLSACYRHLNAYRRGEEFDDESELPHLWHAVCNLAFLITYESDKEKYKTFNDLWAYNNER